MLHLLDCLVPTAALGHGLKQHHWMLQMEGEMLYDRAPSDGAKPWTLLMCAASQGHLPAMDLLLAKGGQHLLPCHALHMEGEKAVPLVSFLHAAWDVPAGCSWLV